MAKNITLMGADYPDVPAVQLPQTGGGKATFYDIEVIDNLNSDSATDALSAKQGKILYNMINQTITGTLDESNMSTTVLYPTGKTKSDFVPIAVGMYRNTRWYFDGKSHHIALTNDGIVIELATDYSYYKGSMFQIRYL